MDSNIKTQLFDNLQERVINRKAMFIPLVCLSTFALVGYSAVDKEAPIIDANRIEVLYGEELTADMFAISDNRDSLSALDIEINDKSYDPNQLGTYKVDVAATDLFSNTTEKTVEVVVVDKTAPDYEVVGDGNGYVIEVEAGGSTNVKDYIRAVDNVDGDVTAFIEADSKLDSSKLGSQSIGLNVSDNAGNVSKETYDFLVADTTAPEISYNKGKSVTIDYGTGFSYGDYITVTDNYDKKVDVKVEGNVNTKEIGNYPLTIIATDTSGNETASELEVKVEDLSAPKISLSKSSVTVTKGKSFNAKSYLNNANDNKDGNVTSKVKIDSSVNMKKAGNYSVTYSVSDEAGNSTSQTLKVKVESPVPSRSGIAGTGLSKVGSRYVYGATGPNAFDCSGFTQWVYRQHGISLPRTSGAQFSGTRRVSKSNLQAGDLVFFSGTTGGRGISHVGIYIGGGQFVHAANPRKGVRVDSLNSSYYSSHFAGGGRK